MELVSNKNSFFGKVDAGEFNCLKIEIYVDSKEGTDVTKIKL
jgi:hypothetical protein